MIIVMRPKVSEDKIHHVLDVITKAKLKPVPLYGTERTVIAVIGDERILHEDMLKALPGVEKVMSVLKPYKLASRESKHSATVVDVDGVKVGGKNVVVIAGPCSVESESQIVNTAWGVKAAGATMLRGGAFKPRTSPYDFQGLGEEGLKLLQKAKKETGLPIVTEVMDTRDVEVVARYADVLQVGARNVQNFNLLKQVGKAKKPVILKRGFSSTLKELLMSAEYIMSEGNSKVILCERGIRTFSDFSRNTLDLNIVPELKVQTHLPVIVDPSHGTGKAALVKPMALAGVACGADGLLLEVHENPEKSVSDADQSISPAHLGEIMEILRGMVGPLGRTI